MRNKLILAISIFVVLFAVLVLLLTSFFQNTFSRYLLPKPGSSGFAGGLYSTPRPEDLKQSEAMYKLQNSLPYSQGNLSVIDYNYANGKFIITTTSNPDKLEAEFDSWYEASEYKAIPKEMFLLQK